MIDMSSPMHMMELPCHRQIFLAAGDDPQKDKLCQIFPLSGGQPLIAK